MKLKSIWLALLLISAAVTAQCPSGSVTFNNQEQVDAFIASYPTCTVINGNVIIDNTASDPIGNFNSLQNITTITGSVIFNASANIPNLL